MKYIIDTHRKYLLDIPLYYNNNNIIKDIASKLNTDKMIILSGLIGVWKKSIVKELIKKTQLDDSFFYFNKDLDFENKITSSVDLEKLLNVYKKQYSEPKIIILENINHLEEIKDFIKKIYTEKKYRCVIVWNHISIPLVKELQVHSRQIKDLNISKYNISNILKYWLLPDVVHLNNKHYQKLILDKHIDEILLKDIY